MRRSQTEILGLAVVFVLIIFGFLIYLWLSGGTKDTTLQDYRDPKMSSSILNAMLKTSVRCDNAVYSVTDFLKDCTDPNLGLIRCDSYAYNFNDADYQSPPYPQSCRIAEDVVRRTLNLTMDEYKLPYWVRVSLDKSDNIFYVTTSSKGRICSADVNQKEPAVQPYELSRGTLEISFGICRI